MAIGTLEGAVLVAEQRIAAWQRRKLRVWRWELPCRWNCYCQEIINIEIRHRLELLKLIDKYEGMKNGL